MSKHKTIIMGRVCRKMYFTRVRTLSKNTEVLTRSYKETIEYKPIWSGELDFIATKFETIYVKELDASVIIDSIQKSTDGIIYNTDYVIELIEDDKTLESEIKAKKEYDNYTKALENMHLKYSKKNKGSKFFENFFNFLFNKPID